MSDETTPTPESSDQHEATPSASTETEVQTSSAAATNQSPRRTWLRRCLLPGLFLLVVGATLIVTYVLVTIIERREEARMPWLRVQEINEVSVDAALWGRNWPHHYEQYLLTAGDKFYGGAETLPESRLDRDPWLKRLFAGYAFSVDYREARGHAYMLQDQLLTERIHGFEQAGACLHCHASVNVLYRKAGLAAMGKPTDEATLAAEFNMPAVIRGFQELSRKPYFEVLQMLTQVPDGTPPVYLPKPTLGDLPKHPNYDVERPGMDELLGNPQNPLTLDDAPPGHFAVSKAHPVSCIDCHNPETLELRITRPGFVLGIQEFAEGKGNAEIFPSIERWRRGNRREPYDPNELASRHEMRSFVCAQCHVEYYCATEDVLMFPWGHGLKAEEMERYWDEHVFPDGRPFYDFFHAETGARMFKVQHPEFELWSQGIHARAGVSCADCHMAYERVGAMKLSNHTVQSPLENISNACQVCHNEPEEELRSRVETIQQRTEDLRQRAAKAMIAMLDAINQAQAAGASEEQLADILVLQRRAMWRLDYIVSENSLGFHAPQEAARILAESIDYSRQAESAALRLRTPPDPEVELPEDPVDYTPGR